MDFYIMATLGFIFIGLPLTYLAGLAWSRGFHKAKRQFITEVMKDSLKEDSTDAK